MTFARTHQHVEGVENLIDRRAGIEGVKLQQIDVIGAKSRQRGIDRPHQTLPRRTSIVRTIAHRQAGLGRDQEPIAPGLDGRAKPFLRCAVRIDVRGIEQGDTGIETDVDQPPRFFHAAVAPGGEQRSFAAERAGAEAQCGNLEARCAQIAILHVGFPCWLVDG